MTVIIDHGTFIGLLNMPARLLIMSGTPAQNGRALRSLRAVYTNIEYPQDINLLNQCREDLEGIVDEICRPIVRGKAKDPTEFGAKLDISIDNGFARIEKLSIIRSMQRERSAHRCCRKLLRASWSLS